MISIYFLSLLLLWIQTKGLAEHNITAGNFARIYDPSVGQKNKWYINDHSFIRDTNGLWHLFGITHTEPADPMNEVLFSHSTAKQLSGPWIKQKFALEVDYKYFGETHLWAPHVIRVNQTYYMFYNSGGTDRTKYAISLATSQDLFHWTRLSSGPLFRDGYDARDPMVIKIDDLWHMYYCATNPSKGGNHVVAYRTSHDLINWSQRQIAFTDPSVGTYGGPTESPFVVHLNGFWHLFIGPRNDYRKTAVFRSKSATNFTISQQMGTIASHAAEVVFDGQKWWISHCGWGQGGVYLAPLYF